VPNLTFLQHDLYSLTRDGQVGEILACVVLIGTHANQDDTLSFLTDSPDEKGRLLTGVLYVQKQTFAMLVEGPSQALRNVLFHLNKDSGPLTKCKILAFNDDISEQKFAKRHSAIVNLPKENKVQIPEDQDEFALELFNSFIQDLPEKLYEEESLQNLKALLISNEKLLATIENLTLMDFPVFNKIHANNNFSAKSITDEIWPPQSLNADLFENNSFS